jgi:hypothetical protein
MLAREEIGEDDTVAVGLGDGELTFKRKASKAAAAEHKTAV